MSTLRKDNFIELVEIVNTSYNPDIRRDGWVPIRHEFEVIGYIIHRSDSIIVSFKGSNQPQDFLNSLKTKRVRFDNEEKVLVHQGYHERFLSIRGQLHEQVNRRLTERIPIIFTGHSYGGALAQLTALYYSKNYIYTGNVYTCVTFGSTKVGGSEFVKLFNSSVEFSHRFVCFLDPIPSYPGWLLYSHTKGEYILNNGLGCCDFLKTTTLTDHRLETYATRLRDEL